MYQVRKRFTDEQTRVLLQGYDQGQLRRTDMQELLVGGESRLQSCLCSSLPSESRTAH